VIGGSATRHELDAMHSRDGVEALSNGLVISMDPESVFLTPQSLKDSMNGTAMRAETLRSHLHSSGFRPDLISNHDSDGDPPSNGDFDDDDEDEDDDDDEGEFNRNSLRQSLRESDTLRSERVQWDCTQWFDHHRILFLSASILSALTSSLWVVIDSNSLRLSLMSLYLTMFLLSAVMLWRALWVVVCAVLWNLTQRRWFRRSATSPSCQGLFFCVNHSGTYIWWSSLSLAANALFLFVVHCPEHHHFGRLVAATSWSAIEVVEHSLECALVLSASLFLKTLLIRWLCLKHYLAGNLRKIKEMVRYEKWLKVLLKRKAIFSMKTEQFLDIAAPLMVDTVMLRLDVLFLQDEFNLFGLDNRAGTSSNNTSGHDQNSKRNEDEDQMAQQLVNTLTSSAIFTNCSQKEHALNVQSCILWIYNSKTKRVDVIDDNELDKICRLFAKFIVFSVTKNREHSTFRSPAENALAPRPGFAAMQSMFRQMDGPDAADADGYVDCDGDGDGDGGGGGAVVYDDGGGQHVVGRHLMMNGDGNVGGDGVPKTPRGPMATASSSSTASDAADECPPCPALKVVASDCGPTAPSFSSSTAPWFITEQEFLSCFSRHRRTKWGVSAWKEMNVSEQQLTRKELHRWLYGYLHSLIFLKQALSSYPELLSNLDLSSNVFVAFAMFLVFLLIFGVEFTDSMATYASTVAILAVFGRNVFTQFFDAIYLIFVLCPFEVGDTVIIDGARFQISAIHIMATEMITAVSAGNTVVTKCNSSLMGKDISNLSRTPNPYHHLTFYVSQNTTTRQLNELKTKIDSFIRSEMNNDIRDTWFVMQGVDRECRMNISLFVGSIYSFSDNNAMWRQIHILNKQIREEVTKMGVQYRRFSANEVTLKYHPHELVAATESMSLPPAAGGGHRAGHRRRRNQQNREQQRIPPSGTASAPTSTSTSPPTLQSSSRMQSHGMLVQGARTVSASRNSMTASVFRKRNSMSCQLQTQGLHSWAE